MGQGQAAPSPRCLLLPGLAVLPVSAWGGRCCLSASAAECPPAWCSVAAESVNPPTTGGETEAALADRPLQAGASRGGLGGGEEPPPTPSISP